VRRRLGNVKELLGVLDSDSALGANGNELDLWQTTKTFKKQSFSIHVDYFLEDFSKW
jgi:hypothetical protein